MRLMKILFWVLSGISLAVTAAIVLLVIFLETAAPGLVTGVARWLLSEPELTELASATSLDGKFVASLYSDPDGGAWSETNYVLYLSEVGKDKDRDGPLFVARRLTYPRLAWDGDILNVSYGYAHLDWYRGSWRPSFCFNDDCKIEIRMKPDCSPCGSSGYALQADSNRPKQ